MLGVDLARVTSWPQRVHSGALGPECQIIHDFITVHLEGGSRGQDSKVDSVIQVSLEVAEQAWLFGCEPAFLNVYCNHPLFIPLKDS